MIPPFLPAWLLTGGILSCMDEFWLKPIPWGGKNEEGIDKWVKITTCAIRKDI